MITTMLDYTKAYTETVWYSCFYINFGCYFVVIVASTYSMTVFSFVLHAHVLINLVSLFTGIFEFNFFFVRESLKCTRGYVCSYARGSFHIRT